MTWSNWLYLGFGLGLGVGVKWLLGRQQEALPSQPSLPAPAPVEAADVPGLQQQLRAAQLAYQLADNMSQFKAGFLARTTHELRSPLNSMIGLHQLILSDLCDDPAEEREFVAQAHESALKLVKLLDEVLAVARTEYGTNPLEIQPLQLTWALEEVYQLTHLLTANRNLPFQVSPPDPEIYVLADSRWLRQLLVNLVDTSVAQMEEGSISISAQPMPTAESVYIWVDVQVPIRNWNDPVNLLQSAATPIEPVRENIAPSPGMTLLLSQTILDFMNGRLEVLPVPNAANEFHFTRFQISIPLMIPETPFAEQAED